MLITVICNHSSYNFCSVQQCTEGGTNSNNVLFFVCAQDLKCGLLLAFSLQVVVFFPCNFYVHILTGKKSSERQTFNHITIIYHSRSSVDVAFNQKSQLPGCMRLLFSQSCCVACFILLSLKVMLNLICTAITRVLLTFQVLSS